ncbi:unnamed protein product [Acanthoscelides obtectus]|uniref:Uncharacterized protein n=1 Tax=Acanthoscelides obtectus TaxID=200917 RepID=A0A9P0L0R1_ACAOB|nr:unnamed protein product [Acanthoscelides obtectus]CAK1676891.1 hypothetical protein AOBTE_LOCUS30988 [Acanthoscelides obtectus]
MTAGINEKRWHIVPRELLSESRTCRSRSRQRRRIFLVVRKIRKGRKKGNLVRQSFVSIVSSYLEKGCIYRSQSFKIFVVLKISNKCAGDYLSMIRP